MRPNDLTDVLDAFVLLAWDKIAPLGRLPFAFSWHPALTMLIFKSLGARASRLSKDICASPSPLIHPAHQAIGLTRHLQ